MTDVAEKFFNDDGSAKLSDIWFRPVEPKDKFYALDDENPTVVQGIDEEKYARYDVFNTDGNTFCGHLDMFYDRGGYLRFIERRKTTDNSFELHVDDLTASMLFGSFNFPTNRSSLTKGMIEAAVKLHKQNGNSRRWKKIEKYDLPQRYTSKSMGG